jgi:hypothetical protein
VPVARELIFDDEVYLAITLEQKNGLTSEINFC